MKSFHVAKDGEVISRTFGKDVHSPAIVPPSHCSFAAPHESASGHKAADRRDAAIRSLTALKPTSSMQMDISLGSVAD